jgi:hypothetical protein
MHLAGGDHYPLSIVFRKTMLEAQGLERGRFNTKTALFVFYSHEAHIASNTSFTPYYLRQCRAFKVLDSVDIFHIQPLHVSKGCHTSANKTCMLILIESHTPLGGGDYGKPLSQLLNGYGIPA